MSQVLIQTLALKQLNQMNSNNRQINRMEIKKNLDAKNKAEYKWFHLIEVIWTDSFLTFVNI